MEIPIVSFKIIGPLNFWVLQWFCVRLAVSYQGNRPPYYCWLTRVVPLTGWWSDYKHVGRINK